MTSRNVLLFAGQGSSLSPDRTRPPPTSATAVRFLEACHQALSTELNSLSGPERFAVEDIVDTFSSTQSLIDPQVHTSAVVQGVVLYIQQILDFISFAGDDTEDSLSDSTSISETAGFCSGILPAIIVSVCPHPGSPEFLDIAVAGFRLSFWIGLRSSLFCRNVAGDDAGNFPWSLTVQGLELDQLETLIAQFNESAQAKLPIRIATTLSDCVNSITGEGQALNEFKVKYLSERIPSRFANIHGYYHGGECLKGTLEAVLADVERRGIHFPSWKALKIPVRSTQDGKHLYSSQTTVSLLEFMLESIFMHQVNWNLTSQLLLRDVLDRLDQDSKLRYSILGLGPNSKSLLRGMSYGSGNPRLQVTSFIPGITDRHDSEDIAIVGMSVDYPSGEGTEQLWDTLEKGLNVVEEVPSSRFQISDYYDPDAKTTAPRKMNSKYGNFLDDPFAFDNTFFQISPREAKSMDPQQRLLLHAALDALEDAGYAPDSTPSFQKDSTGVYVGVATLDYVENARNDIDVYYSPGTLRAFLSGRISYAFQFKGPSIVVDTACSSSTVALYQACRAIQSGECTSALAGGVNVISSPDMYLGLSRAHFLSNTGQCKPWDASADGYSRSEGCGLFVLKKFSDAVAEGDRIHGVIRGIEVNQCGTAKSITHPDSDTQADLFKSLLDKTKTDPDTIGVVEAHGTGTQAGDYAEANSLQAAFGRRKSDNPLTLSSIKGNIGHAEAASGAAGLAKLVLSMEKHQVPPQAAHEQLNPRLSAIKENNIVVPTETTEWKNASGAPRRALLNNFGAAGSNASLILEEFVQPPRMFRSPSRSCHVLNLSAKTAGALERLREEYCAYIMANRDGLSLANLCYSANARRQEFDGFRLSVTDQSVDGILQKLEQAKIPSQSPPSTRKPVTAFVFSGQGSVYQGMGAELLSTAPVFRESVRQCNAVLSDLGFPRVEVLLSTEPEAFHALDPKDRAVVSQCACFAVEYGLAQLWMAWGCAPDVLIGHSLGEYAALATAGVLELHDALLLVARRAELMGDLCQEASTGMVACGVPPAHVKELLTSRENEFEGLTVACINSNDDCVVSGPLASLERFVDHCKASGHKAKQLDVPFGFHSAAMDPILDPFADIASSVQTNGPKIPVASSYLGRLMAENDVTPEYFVRHARQPVEFSRATEALAEMAGEGKIAFVEVGPGPITLPMLKATLKQTEAAYLASMKPKEAPWVSLCSALSSLFLQRTAIQWRQVYAGLDVQFLADLPRYPLSPTTFVIPFQETVPTSKDEEVQAPQSIYKFLNGSRSSSSGGTDFGSKVSAMAEFIKAHDVGGAPLCPASVYIELVLEAMELMKSEGSQNDNFRTLRDLTFDKPLVYSEGKDTEVLTSMAADDSYFRVLSAGSTIHCTGSATLTDDAAISTEFSRRASYIKRQKESIAFVDKFTTRILYDVVFPRVVAYSGPYVTIKHLDIAASGLEAAGTFQLPLSGRDGFVCPPAFTDTLLHAAGFVANSKINADEACICVKVERVIIPCGAENKALYGHEMGVYCGLVECFDDLIIGDAYALDDEGNVVACVEGMHFKRLRLKSFQAHLARSLKPTPTQELRNDSGIKASARPPPRVPPPPRPVQQPSIRETLYSSVSDICGVTYADIQENTRLSDIGVDSLLTIELTMALQQQFSHLGLEGSDFANCETVGEMEAILDRPGAEKDDGTPSADVVPDLSAGRSSPSSEASMTPDSVARVDEFFQQVCGFSLQAVDKNTSLASLGVDSLLSIELVNGLNHTFGIQLDDVSISELSVRALEEVIFPNEPEPPKQQEPPTASGYLGVPESEAPIISGMDTLPVALQKSGNPNEKRAPLYLFHDGSGLCNVYSRLGKLDRDVYGVFSIDFSSIDSSISTLEELASRYIDQLGLTNKDNIMLGGWSFGGVLAFEVSRQLRRRGNTSVQGVILIDSPQPVSHEPLPQAVVSHVCERMPAHTPAMRRIRLAIEAQFQRNARLLGSYNPLSEGAGAGGDVQCVMMKCKETFDAEGLCDVSYPWLSDDGSRSESVKVWESLVGRSVPVLDVSGNHFDLFSPENIKQVSEQLKKASLMLENEK